MVVITRPRARTFEENDRRILANRWFPVAVAADLTDRPAPARLLDVDLVLFRSAGAVVAARDLCPHRGMLLSSGWVSNFDPGGPHLRGPPSAAEIDGIEPRLHRLIHTGSDRASRSNTRFIALTRPRYARTS
jgi:nitrite reductase/ring-hydroxylating ferredoxin subunit